MALVSEPPSLIDGDPMAPVPPVDLVTANVKLAIEVEKKDRRVAVLLTANTKLATRLESKEREIAALHLANRHLAFHSTQKDLRAAALNDLALHDPLTGLPNRRLLIDRLHLAFASSARSGRECALMFINLDHFKDINGTLGQSAGDQLLQQVGQRLDACVNDGDTVARLGGDEFVVMLQDLSKQAVKAATQAKLIGDDILAALNKPYQVGTHVVHSSPSIGTALFNDHYKTAEEVLKHAHLAMYQAKQSGRNTMRFFNPKMQEVVHVRVALENELHKAIEKRQFQLHYQVQMDGEQFCCGAEALLRWDHPERGLVAPSRFIALAEETSLIVPIGQWVLETACDQLKRWAHDPLTRELTLAVNVSAREFHQPDFVAQVQSVIDHQGVNPALLMIEITEGMLLRHVEDAIVHMTTLKKLGIRFSLDDFGTGYSSLQFLKRLPIDQIKIDRSFVKGIASDDSDRAIVRAVIAMARSLDLKVIAEGVETTAQHRALIDAGCAQFQGFLFGMPLPIEAFEARLRCASPQDAVPGDGAPGAGRPA